MYVSSLVSLAYVVHSVCLCVCVGRGREFARQKSRRQARNLNKTNAIYSYRKIPNNSSPIPHKNKILSFQVVTVT